MAKFTDKEREEWISANMKKMSWTREQAEEVWDSDRAIERGEEQEFDLSAEQEKVAKAMRKADRKPTAYKFTPRKTKDDPTKEELIAEMVKFFEAYGCTNVVIANKSQEIDFDMGNDTFYIKLSRKRKPKK